MIILRENCRTKKSSCWSLNGSVTVQEWLTAALECADQVHQYALKDVPMPKGNKRGYEKLPKEKWTELDEIFAAEFQKIWMIKEPDNFDDSIEPNLYSECHKMSESPKFREMIGILEDKVAIVKGDNNAVWDGEGPAGNYSNLLSATERFLKEWDEKKKFVEKISYLSKQHKHRKWEGSNPSL